jgi:hypothetical protein
MTAPVSCRSILRALRASGCALLAGVLAAAPGPSSAEEAVPPPKKVREATPEEVPPIVADLDAAAKKKKLEEVLPLLKKIEELKHPDFEKPLHRLLKHGDAAVALRAAELLEERTYPTSGKALWAASWGNAANDRRATVRAKTLRALGRIAFTLDKKQYDEVDRLWRSLQGDPNRSQAPLLVDIAYYAEGAKEKRLARYLAEAIDEPVSTDDGPMNPPASWWEEKWHLWNESKAAVHKALKAMTGQDFDTTAKARDWIQAHEKEGFAW